MKTFAPKFGQNQILGSDQILPLPLRCCRYGFRAGNNKLFHGYLYLKGEFNNVIYLIGASVLTLFPVNHKHKEYYLDSHP